MKFLIALVSLFIIINMFVYTQIFSDHKGVFNCKHNDKNESSDSIVKCTKFDVT
jgi:hypothetical protein